MAIQVMELEVRGYKIRKVFCLKINCSQMKLSNFENLCCGELSEIGRTFSNQVILKIDGIKKCQKQKMCS